MKIEISKPHDVEVQRRVRRADNCIQVYIEELIAVGKLNVWKIAKIYYSFSMAKKEMGKMK